MDDMKRPTREETESSVGGQIVNFILAFLHEKSDSNGFTTEEIAEEVGVGNWVADKTLHLLRKEGAVICFMGEDHTGSKNYLWAYDKSFREPSEAWQVIPACCVDKTP